MFRVVAIMAHNSHIDESTNKKTFANTAISGSLTKMLNKEQNDEWSPSTSLCSVFWVNLQQNLIVALSSAT
jgi:hypothetical protein